MAELQQLQPSSPIATRAYQACSAMTGATASALIDSPAHCTV